MGAANAAPAAGGCPQGDPGADISMRDADVTLTGVAGS